VLDQNSRPVPDRGIGKAMNAATSWRAWRRIGPRIDRGRWVVGLLLTLAASCARAPDAVVQGVVHTPEGAPAGGVTVHVRAYADQCPGRAAAEETVRTDAAGWFRVRLGSHLPDSFTACVAVHPDPPSASRWGHAALRDSVRFAEAGTPPGMLVVGAVLEGPR
jgi:hypothetical protein